MTKITIEDISRATGLSRGTVSRALNDRPDISAATKLRVLEACRKLNYAPSHAARSLATGRHFSVAVLVGCLEAAFDNSFVRGVLKHAASGRYAVDVVEIRDDDRGATAAVTPDRVDGALVATRLGSAELRWLRETLPNKTVVSAFPLEGVPCDVFEADQAECGRLAARQLVRIAGNAVRYIHVPRQPDAEARCAGFRQECSATGLPADEVIWELSEDDYRRGRFLDALADELPKLRGVATSDDAVALTVMLAAERAGRAPGRDLCVIGQGNDALGRWVRPALTTIDPAGYEIGERAIKTFLQRATEGRKDAPQRTLVAPVFVERATSTLIA